MSVSYFLNPELVFENIVDDAIENMTDENLCQDSTAIPLVDDKKFNCNFRNGCIALIFMCNYLDTCINTMIWAKYYCMYDPELPEYDEQIRMYLIGIVHSSVKDKLNSLKSEGYLKGNFKIEPYWSWVCNALDYRNSIIHYKRPYMEESIGENINQWFLAIKDIDPRKAREEGQGKKGIGVIFTKNSMNIYWDSIKRIIAAISESFDMIEIEDTDLITCNGRDNFTFKYADRISFLAEYPSGTRD